MPFTIIVILSMLVGAATPTSEASGRWAPAAGISWDIQLAIDPDARLAIRSGPIEAIDLDGGETRAETVDALHAQGVRAICYVNVGAWEEWRPDAGSYSSAIVGDEYPGWPGERFVDIRAMELLAPIIRARFDDCAGKGFAAIEPDNIDTAYTDTGFPLTETDQVTFNRWLAAEAHDRGMAIFQKNVPELTAELVEVYDGAITEDCAADGWCDDMEPYLADGKPVLAIEYTDVIDNEAFAALCVDPDLKHVSLVLKHRELDAFGIACDDLESTAGWRAVPGR